MLDPANALEINAVILKGTVCPLQSSAQVIPTPTQLGVAHAAHPCRRDCALFVEDASARGGTCAIKLIALRSGVVTS